MINKISMPNSSKDRRLGFTLIELLVVISIILIASSIIFIGGNSGAGAALSSSQRIVSGIAQGARGQAILKNAKTRLIIHNDPSELDKFRRFFGIIYEDPDTAGNWIAATQGTYLPEGIYFDAETSSRESDSGALWSEAGQGMTIAYPRAGSVAGGSEAFLYYEFNSNGTSANANAYLVLRAAAMIPGAAEVEELRVDEERQGLLAALIFRRAGTTTLVNEPGAITVSDSNEISF